MYDIYSSTSWWTAETSRREHCRIHTKASSFCVGWRRLVRHGVLDLPGKIKVGLGGVGGDLVSLMYGNTAAAAEEEGFSARFLDPVTHHSGFPGETGPSSSTERGLPVLHRDLLVHLFACIHLHLHLHFMIQHVYNMSDVSYHCHN